MTVATTGARSMASHAERYDVKVARPKATRSTDGHHWTFSMTHAPLVTVSTRVMPHESLEKCIGAVIRLFPDWQVESTVESNEFPIGRKMAALECEGCAPDAFLHQLAEQRILDTALDAMSIHLNRDSTWFQLSRQAANAGKIAFILEDEKPIGGVIHVRMQSPDMADWLEAATWHAGRREVPREIGDVLAMTRKGQVNEWFDAKGRATMGAEDQEESRNA
jgi:predicted RNA binding protein with dsRBD fold (UPF0201 family)